MVLSSIFSVLYKKEYSYAFAQPRVNAEFDLSRALYIRLEEALTWVAETVTVARSTQFIT